MRNPTVEKPALTKAKARRLIWTYGSLMHGYGLHPNLAAKRAVENAEETLVAALAKRPSRSEINWALVAAQNRSKGGQRVAAALRKELAEARRELAEARRELAEARRELAELQQEHRRLKMAFLRAQRRRKNPTL